MAASTVSRPRAAKTLCLSIGGLGFELTWEEDLYPGWSHERYDPFQSPGSDPIRLKMRSGRRDLPSGAKLLFDFKPHWRLYEYGEGFIVEAFEPLTKAPNQRAFFDPSLTEAEVYTIALRPEALAAESSPPLEPEHPVRLMNTLGKLLLASRLPSYQGLMLHGLAVNDNGAGRLFIGASGSGKSTMAGFFQKRPGSRVLGDEHVILRKVGGRFMAYGTPWPGMNAEVSAGPIEVRQVFLIRHHLHHQVIEGPPAEFIGDLFAQVYIPRWNPELVSSGLAVCEDLLRTVACRRLGFAKSEDVVDFVRNLNGGSKL